MILAEIYAQIARGRGRLTLGAAVRNLGWMMTRAVFAARHARAYLAAALHVARATAANGIEAWARADLAILTAARRPEEARRHLQEAERLAPAAGSTMVERNIAEARTLLGVPGGVSASDR